jgi:hypothetical protein
VKKFVVLSLVLVLVAACGTMVAAAPLKSVMVTDVGGLGDQSFNDAAWRGLCRAEEELGVDVGVVESCEDQRGDTDKSFTKTPPTSKRGGPQGIIGQKWISTSPQDYYRSYQERQQNRY